MSEDTKISHNFELGCRNVGFLCNHSFLEGYCHFEIKIFKRLWELLDCSNLYQNIQLPKIVDNLSQNKENHYLVLVYDSLRVFEGLLLQEG